MAKKVDFSNLSPRAQQFFKDKAASKKSKAASKRKGGSKGGGS